MPVQLTSEKTSRLREVIEDTGKEKGIQDMLKSIVRGMSVDKNVAIGRAVEGPTASSAYGTVDILVWP